jgi:hypothetical protein
VNSIRLVSVGMIVSIAVGSACTSAAPIREPVGPTPYEPPPSHLDWSTTYVEIELDGKTWDEALTWIAAQTRLPIVSQHKVPDGTLTVITPKGRKYSLAEIFDLINRRLMAEEKFTLLRGQGSLVLFPADDVMSIPTHLISRVKFDDLPRRGQTEIVEVLMSRRGAREAGLEPFEPPVAYGRRPVAPTAAIQAFDNDCVVIRSDVATLRRHLDR